MNAYTFLPAAGLHSDEKGEREGFRQMIHTGDPIVITFGNDKRHSQEF